MQWLLIPFVALTGMFHAAQTGANNQLAKAAGEPIVAGLAVYVIGFGTLAALAPLLGAGPGATVRMFAAPWWAWLGGIGGALYVAAMLYATAKVGSGVFIGVSFTAAIVTSVVLDHFGWLGLPQHPAGALRLLGAGLMIAGVALVSAF